MTDALDPHQPIESIEPLIEHLQQGCKPVEQFRIGTEHEKFGFRKKDLAPIPYEGCYGIRVLLEVMATRFEWEPIKEADNIIGLIKDGASVTLEPGGQLELSGAPLATIHETQDEINEHLRQLGEVCRDLDIAFLGMGAQPKWSFKSIPWMPKGRYRVMREYLPAKGKLSLDMMARTATVQANMDFSSEADMVDKYRLSLALQPLVTALFANSPFLDGEPNGFLSYRGEVWRHTDPDRCGVPPFVFEEGFGFARYAEYALDTPMLFLYRDGEYSHADGIPFRAFLEGKHPKLPGVRPTMEDWKTHLSTLFPDVRLKQYLEMRGADSGNSANLCALPALFKGLLHDEAAMRAAWKRVAHWSWEERLQVATQAPKLGLNTPISGTNKETLQDLALSILEIARQSLMKQAQRNANGCDESVFLTPLFDVASSGETPAERLLNAYHNRWNQSVDPLFREEEVDSFYAECG
ncbi:glutamate--cysteine ligase [Magnetofaba australis]|uniref:Glutamate--cysteine ligase n=1 Tax=Magnetofaba australis IT-1 TaxID=1434232 RepID=A0A1Y2JZQ1_9PROT|nr:glutamate--cysteine ligase [Magnetofaba australis]OSM00395.1 putative glutamate--cysteine ligase [Magnetofaba australis IT-1]